MKFVAGFLAGLCLGWMLASQYPGGADQMVREMRASVQSAMPWTR